MRKDTLLVVVLGVLAFGAGALVLYYLGRGGDEGFVPADETFVETDQGIGRAARRETMPGPATGSGVESLTGAGTSTPQPAETRMSESVTALRGTVVDPAGQPVRGAVAALFTDLSDVADFSLQGPLLASVETGEDGRFAFEGIGFGVNHLLRVEHPGFASEGLGNIVLDENEVRRIEVRLEAGYPLSGEVLDQGGNPVVDAVVRTVDQGKRAMDPTASIEREVRTDASGRFEFPHLTEGIKRVTASKEGYATVTKVGVEVRPGAGVEFLNFVLDAGVPIEGLVLDEQDRPVADAIVMAEPVRRGVRNVVSGNYLPVKTDAEGAFKLSGLLEGTYRLTCSKFGYGLDKRTTARTGGDPVVIRLKRFPVVSGRVVDDETGDPVTSFTLVLARDASLVFTATQQVQRFDDPEGRFEYANVTAKGDFCLHAEARGYAWTPSVMLACDGATDIEGIEIRLTKGALVRGRVIDGDGKPVAGAEVELMPESEGPGGDAENFLRMLQRNMRKATRSGRTDAEGNYVIDNVHGGRFAAVARHPQFAAGAIDPPVNIPAVGESKMPDLVMMRGGTIQGVVEERDGRSGASAMVRVSPKASFGPGGETYTVRCDANGRFELRNVRPGIYYVDVTEREGRAGDLFANLLTRANQRTEIIIADGETLKVSVR